MSFFSRLGNLFSGFLSLFVKGLEIKNPEAVYEQSIEKQQDRYIKLRQASGGIIARRDAILSQLDEKKREQLKVASELSAAIQTGQEEIGAFLIQRQEQLQAAIDGLEADAQTAVKDAEEAKSQLLEMQANIASLKAEKSTNIARMKSAEARIAIQDQLKGLSAEDDIKALDNVRESVKSKLSEANLNSELNDSNLDSKLAKLRTSAGAVNAKAKFEEMRKQYEQQHQQQAAEVKK